MEDGGSTIIVVHGLQALIHILIQIFDLFHIY